LPPLAVGCGGGAGGSSPSSSASGDDGGAGPSQTADTGSGGDEGAGWSQGGDDGGAAGDGGPGGPGAALYARLGGHTGLREKMDGVLQAELGDPQIASYFVHQLQNPPAAGHPSFGQISECLTDMLGSSLGGKEAYPTVVTDDSGTTYCRNMVAIHMLLDISGGTFDRFVMIAAGQLQSDGVSPDDIRAIGSVLASTRTDIVDPEFKDAGVMPYNAGPFTL
jgi:hypothetical protein